MSNIRRLGVGIVGAGPVTQAIHVPALARLSDLFHVANVMDVNPEVASSVAHATGGNPSGSIEELLADPNVEVVAICSPPQFHAQQVIAAMEAGKRGVLCEKPLATSPEEAERILEASERTGVPVIVGAMHVFDPAWIAASRAWAETAPDVNLVRSRIVIPMNDRFEDWATEIHTRPEIARGQRGGPLDEAAVRAMFSGVVLGLTVHDLPLVRSVLPAWADLHVDAARSLSPFGYLIDGHAGDIEVQLIGAMHGHWEAYWEFEAIAESSSLHVRFTPSFVQGGSAVAVITRDDGTSTTYGPFEANGYENEWRALHAALSGDLSAIPRQQSFLDDLAFTLAVADRAGDAAAQELTK